MECLVNEMLQANEPAQASEVIQRANSLLLTMEWPEIDLHGNTFFCNIVNILGQKCPLDVLSVLEAVAARYNREINSNALTLIHAYIAMHCSKYRVSSKLLAAFEGPSTDFLIPNEALVEQYFVDGARVYAYMSQWSNAAIFMSIALTVAPSRPSYQSWCLYELIANGSVMPLPRVAWPPVACKLTDDFAKLFSTRSRAGWCQIVEYVSKHRTEFENAALLSVVRRAMATYYTLLAQDILRTVSAAPISALFGDFLQEFTWDELTSAGILSFCEIRGDTVLSAALKTETRTEDLLAEAKYYESR